MKRLLVVDDEEDMVWTLQKNLKNGIPDLEVLAARSGEEALALLLKHRIDLIVTDIKMPGISGLELLMKVKKAYPDTGVIVMTAFPTPEFKRDAVYKGCLNFIEKPFDINHLREIVRKALSQDRGFRGTVTGMELSDILQVNYLSRITAALRVKTLDREGIVFFKDGRVVHALCENLEGKEAFYEILGFEGGALESMKGAEAPMVTIDTSFEALLMEGFRRLDEARRHTGGKKEEMPAIFEGMISTKEETMENVKSTLKQFTAIDGVVAACLVGRDGFVIDSVAASDIDSEMIGAIAATGIGASESMGRQISKGSLTLGMIEYERGPIFLSPVGEDAFLVIVAEGNSNLGMIRLAAKKHRNRLSLESVL